MRGDAGWLMSNSVGWLALGMERGRGKNRRLRVGKQ